MLFITYIIEFSDVSYNSKLYNVLYILCTSPDYVTIRSMHILIIISNHYDYNYFSEHSTEIFDHVIKSSGPYVMAESMNF